MKLSYRPDLQFHYHLQRHPPLRRRKDWNEKNPFVLSFRLIFLTLAQCVSNVPSSFPSPHPLVPQSVSTGPSPDPSHLNRTHTAAAESEAPRRRRRRVAMDTQTLNLPPWNASGAPAKACASPEVRDGGGRITLTCGSGRISTR